MATSGREFSNSKSAGRNESEPTGSLVNQIEEADPVVKRGRPPSGAEITELATRFFRGSRVGMCWKICSPVLEACIKG